MYWYNPTTRHDEDVLTPLNNARAIEMFSGHPDSEEFIEEYRRRRKTHGIEKAMIITGEAFFRNHHPAKHHKKRGLTHAPSLPVRRALSASQGVLLEDGLRIL